MITTVTTAGIADQTPIVKASITQFAMAIFASLVTYIQYSVHSEKKSIRIQSS